MGHGGEFTELNSSLNRSILAVTALLLISVLPAGCLSQGEVRGSGETLPAFAYTSAISLESYRLAVREAEFLSKLPCYCGCVDVGHASLKECFIKPDGRFEEHGAGCDLCGQIALDAAALKAQGLSLREIRTRLEAKYLEYGKPTDTPWPD